MKTEKTITVIATPRLIEEIARQTGVTVERAREIVKQAAAAAAQRFHRHGRHPNSLANLKPQRRGAKGRNPWGRAGRQSAELEESVFGPGWRKLKADINKTDKMLTKSIRETFGISRREFERRAGL